MKSSVKLFKLNKLLAITALAVGCGTANMAFANQDYYGEWMGEATQIDNKSEWNISMSLNENKLLISYPTLKCGGHLEFLEKKGNKFIFIEHITENKGRCADKGTIHLTKIDNDKLDWEYYRPNGVLNAKTQVARKRNAKELKEFMLNPSQYQKELMANGLWYDERTGLIWDRCSAGKSWNGTTCEGSAWDDDDDDYKSLEGKVASLNAGHHLGSNQWKIPTILQLHTLIRCSDWESSREIPMQPFSDKTMKVWAKCGGSNNEPKIDEAIFPGLPKKSVSFGFFSPVTSNDRYYYSSTKDDKSGLYWGSDIDNGHIYTLEGNTYYNHVRLVIDTHSKGLKAYQDLLFNKHNVVVQEREKAEQKAENERQIKLENFRKKLKVGDDTTDGIVIEIKGNLVKIQANNRQCTQRDYNSYCTNYIDTPVEKWFKRRELYPANP